MGSKVKREENRVIKCKYLCSYDEDRRYKRRLVDGISNTSFETTDFTD
uniref:Uncharacterized protein n=1 Tax=Candidatus Methanophaga sp. ANME-1 ERB7 TaxID=2759913 RepID=A0A7G9Z8X7_9EURY|nr:hypothetical protein JBENMAEK_00030 [Methanosarcinales archaeon ANME-1 ERB7]